MQQVLDIYCKASRQQINVDKSSIHFAKGCRQSLRVEIMDILDVHNESLNQKYLGMPTDVGIATIGAFKYLKDRVWSKVQGWMEQCLSAGGKEVLIKSVARAISTFSMSCFRLQRGLCQHIDGLLRNFWWRCENGERKTCWVAWDNIVQPKYMGGLGFRDLELFNLALLAKQAWRVLQDSDSLSARVLKAVYFPDVDFLAAQLGSSPSRIWHSIIDGREVLMQGLIRRIGSGENTNIWSMDWLPVQGLRRPVSSNKSNPLQHVSELIDMSTVSWDKAELHKWFSPSDVEAITKIPLSTRHQEDFWAWHHEKSGVFNVRSAYRMLITNRSLENRTGRSNVRAEEKEWTTLWGIKVPSKI
jgi:hypothetical protein